MIALYEKGSANYPRIKTDKMFADYENRYFYGPLMDGCMRFVTDRQLTNEVLWARFVRQFREDADIVDAGWRGEYWGKMMRGACFVYSYTRSEQLYSVLSKTVEDMILCADAQGRISTYSKERELDGWDLWCRKYVLLGMQYFLEICKDRGLYDRTVASMRAQVDYLIGKIGNGQGKKPITSATRNWRGLNSSSILEPVVRLYSLTGDKKYLDFATYIVEQGGTGIVNVFELAYADELYPYQYPITKAYEMTSCFEGLLEYYRIVGNERHKTAIINFANRVIESDFTVIGCCGCTHELFDHSTVRQANPTPEDDKRMQETCVTVTLMKFFYQLTLISGDARYVDAFETSLYNAYLGAFNTEGVVEPSVLANHPDWNIEPLPFDSYSPLVAGTRGVGIGGVMLMSDMHYYGCCACIGSAGIGLVPKMQLMSTEGGFALNLFIDGTVTSRTPSGREITFTTSTDYPRSGSVRVTLSLANPERMELLIRRPSWSKRHSVAVNGERAEQADGYIAIEREWHDGDVIAIDLDMSTEAIRPTPYGSQILMSNVIWKHDYTVPVFDKEPEIAGHHIALRRGPLMLAQENRLGYSVDDPISVKVDADGIVALRIPEVDTAPYPHIFEAQVPLADGSYMTVTDYASAGKLWTDESKMAVWMLTE